MCAVRQNVSSICVVHIEVQPRTPRPQMHPACRKFSVPPTSLVPNEIGTSMCSAHPRALATRRGRLVSFEIKLRRMIANA
jgi:hypothetical protein